MVSRILIEAGHFPDRGGAPGEAEWAKRLADQLAARLREEGVAVVVVGSWYGSAPPPEAAAPYDLSLHLHYDASVYAEGQNTGCITDRWSYEAKPSEAERFIAIWESIYPQATGIPLRNERRNPNTSRYYAYAGVQQAPSVLLEHGCGANAGKWWQGRWYPPGQDAELLHEHIDLIAALDAAAILDFLGVTTSESEGPTEEEVANVAILSDAQAEIVATVLWDGRGVVFNPASAIGRGWVARWRAGAYAGRPMGPERTLPGGVVVQEFDAALACWVPGEAEASWTG